MPLCTGLGHPSQQTWLKVTMARLASLLTEILLLDFTNSVPLPSSPYSSVRMPWNPSNCFQHQMWHARGGNSAPVVFVAVRFPWRLIVLIDLKMDYRKLWRKLYRSSSISGCWEMSGCWRGVYGGRTQSCPMLVPQPQLLWGLRDWARKPTSSPKLAIC